jgi:hypothetical protein
MTPPWACRATSTATRSSTGTTTRGDYQVLPVRVRLEWQGKNGPRVLEVRTMVTDR